MLDEPRTIGDTSHGTIEPIHVTWTDIVGSDAGVVSRISAGALLSMADLCAAQVAHRAAAEARQRDGKSYQCCTVGVTNTLFSGPILSGDAVSIDGRIVHCGSSSLGVYLQFFRQSYTTRARRLAGESFFTMVMITPDLQPAKIVPAVRLRDRWDVMMHQRYLRIHELQRASAKAALVRRGATTPLSAEDVDCPVNQGKLVHVPIHHTTTRARRIFFSSFLNFNNTVFGGELMAWMEKHAVHCGRMFTGHHHVFTIGMHSVSFDQPLFANDWVTLEANVIYVRNSTMEIDVKLRVERDGTHAVMTNRASFILINQDETGQKVDIAHGIDLRSATQEELHLFLDAKERYRASMSCKDDLTSMTKILENSSMC